jgi:CRP-like cAMP-binding protein
MPTATEVAVCTGASTHWKRNAIANAGVRREYGQPGNHTPATGLRRGPERLRALGIANAADLDAFWKLVTIRTTLSRGEAIARSLRSGKYLTVLLGGLACMAARQENGRQIYAIHHSGDFVGLHGLVYGESTGQIEVEALSDCSIGTIDRDALEKALQRHPAIGQALWRAAMIEASVFRQQLVMARWPAAKRVAHLLCEQLYRLGSGSRIVPLSQIDVADAVGLTAGHTSRTLQDLRKLGLLSEKRCIEVVDKERLQEVAAFDSHYLDPADALSRWDVRIEG